MSVTDAFSSQGTTNTNPYEKQQNLAVPFDLSKCGRHEKNYYIDLINEAAQSETAKKILEKAAAEGYKIASDSMSHLGSCRPKEKEILLSRSLSFEKAVSSLVHEARHAGQHADGANAYYNPDVLLKDQLVEKRLMEADAVAMSLLACHELKEKGNAEPMEAASDLYHREIAAFEDTLKAGGSKEEAMTNCALAWYENEGRKFKCEIRHIAAPLSMGENLNNQTGKYKDLSIQDCINTICTMDGKPYFTKPEELKDPKRSGVSDTMKEWLNVHCNFTRAEGIEPESSIEKLPVYHPSSVYVGRVDVPPLYPAAREKIGTVKKQQQTTQAVIAAKVAKSR